MNVLAVEAIHPHWKGRLLLSTADGTVEHEHHKSRGIFTQQDDRITVHWEKFPPDVFVVTSTGTLVHETIKPLKVDDLYNVSIDGQTFLVSRISVALPGSGYVVAMRACTSDIPTFTQVFTRHEYESENLPETARTIVDLGGNIGLASVFFALKYPNAKILAVEPEADNFRMLEDNVRLLGERISAVRAAIWCEDGEINLFTEAEDGSALGAWGVQVSAEARKGSRLTPCYKLPTLMQKFGIDHIDVLKVDIEGAELELFSESTEEWLHKVDLIVAETHERFRPGSHSAVLKALAADFEQLPTKGENLFFRRRAKATPETKPSEAMATLASAG
ncbi:FkbM family methyltransferase [Roseixanthobacter liquoris]|uniref:FkbM family methyltransferase n=1 Tax=Roseixanthobacter liquoris TaxID=3119921 RepID=UPI0037276529